MDEGFYERSLKAYVVLHSTGVGFLASSPLTLYTPGTPPMRKTLTVRSVRAADATRAIQGSSKF